MIKEHKFNTEWFGRPVGIVEDVMFFQLCAEEQRELLGKYSWTVYRTMERDIKVRHALQSAGFIYADTIQHFLVKSSFPRNRFLEEVSVITGFDHLICVERSAMRSFKYERFFLLPGVTQVNVDDRYFLWMNKLLKQHSELAIEVRLNNKPQGWFFAEPSGSNINVLLGVLKNDAKLSGSEFYRKGFDYYASRTYDKLHGSFSIRHLVSHNIFSNMGVYFNATEDIFFHVNYGKGKSAFAVEWLDRGRVLRK